MNDLLEDHVIDASQKGKPELAKEATRLNKECGELNIAGLRRKVGSLSSKDSADFGAKLATLQGKFGNTSKTFANIEEQAGEINAVLQGEGLKYLSDRGSADIAQAEKDLAALKADIDGLKDVPESLK